VRILAMALLAAVPGTPASEPAEGPVWSWFATCGGPVLMVELKVDQTQVLEASVPICHQLREGAASQGQSEGQIHFTFRPRRSIVWSGYGEKDDITPANSQLEGAIWQAGSDPDDLLIGIIIGDAGKNLMHTIHTAQPNAKKTTTLAKGVVLRTYPAQSANAK